MANRKFPGGKFERLAEILTKEGLAGHEGFHEPRPLDSHDFERAHDRDYVKQVLTGRVPEKIEKEIGFPVHDRIAYRARCASGGTLMAAHLALRFGLACNSAGGGHHARWAHGAGFCVFNDVAVSIRALKAVGLIERALVIDCDVHQGDGTADIFRDDRTVFTFSIHGQKNYPTRKINSDLDVGLPDGTGDEAYLEALRETVPSLIRSHGADIVFYNAGVDPHKEDRLGRLNLTDTGLRERDRYVIGVARENLIPVVCVVGGGYSNDIEALAERHAGLYRVASEFV